MVYLHRNRTCRTSLGAEAALNTPGFLFDHYGGQIETFGLLHGHAIESFHKGGKPLATLNLVEPRHPETEFWTDIDTAATKNAFRPIEDGEDVALEAPLSLFDRLLFRKS